VPFAIPGERVVVEVVDDRKRWARARLVEILEASADRVDPPCPYFGAEEPGGSPRCGGCKLQHVAPPRQAVMKQRIVVEQLQRIGGIADPPVAETVTPATFGYRAQSRFAVDEQGRLGYRRLRGNDVVPIDTCLLLTPEAQAARDEAGDGWVGVEEVTVRHGRSEGALVVQPGPGGLPPLPDGELAVAVRTPTGTVDLRGESTMEVAVGDLSYRVSPTSFFQAGPQGAAAILRLVREAAAVGPGDTALDLYAGVGLFAKALASDGATVTAVESHASACADAEINLAGLPAAVLRDKAERAVRTFTGEGRWFDVVVLDPPRAGAGAQLCAALPELEPRAIVYVSCDPAALARDARALIAVGYTLEVATPVDQFAQTAAIETVAVFRPA
jgi:tRNA/tmRNA/rRNA uracil-C5-methylase (TrmA/RlmC/RlmD family)